MLAARRPGSGESDRRAPWTSTCRSDAAATATHHPHPWHQIPDRLCPGSYDPVTNGHLDVISARGVLFDDLVVAVVNARCARARACSAGRSGCWFVEDATSGRARNVEVKPFWMLLVEYARLRRGQGDRQRPAGDLGLRVRVGDQPAEPHRRPTWSRIYLMARRGTLSCHRAEWGDRHLRRQHRRPRAWEVATALKEASPADEKGPAMDVLVLIDKLDELVHNAKPVPLTEQGRVERRRSTTSSTRCARRSLRRSSRRAGSSRSARRCWRGQARGRAHRRGGARAPGAAHLPAGDHQAGRARGGGHHRGRPRTRAQIRLGAEDYADEILNTLEVNLSKFIAAVQRGQSAYRAKTSGPKSPEPFSAPLACRCRGVRASPEPFSGCRRPQGPRGSPCMARLHPVSRASEAELWLSSQSELSCGIQVADTDITRLEVDAISNAANTELRHAGGVAAADHLRGLCGGAARVARQGADRARRGGRDHGGRPAGDSGSSTRCTDGARRPDVGGDHPRGHGLDAAPRRRARRHSRSRLSPSSPASAASRSTRRRASRSTRSAGTSRMRARLSAWSSRCAVPRPRARFRPRCPAALGQCGVVGERAEVPELVRVDPPSLSACTRPSAIWRANTLMT